MLRISSYLAKKLSQYHSHVEPNWEQNVKEKQHELWRKFLGDEPWAKSKSPSTTKPHTTDSPVVDIMPFLKRLISLATHKGTPARINMIEDVSPPETWHSLLRIKFDNFVKADVVMMYTRPSSNPTKGAYSWMIGWIDRNAKTFDRSIFFHVNRHLTIDDFIVIATFKAKQEYQSNKKKGIIT